MRELVAQSLIVRAVKEHGGVAFKMSNRFLVGVADLFIQLPGCPTSLWEAKMNKTKLGIKDFVEVGLTKPQENFLRDLARAGGACGTISFVQDGHALYVSIQPGPVRRFSKNWYTLLERGKKEEMVVEMLHKVLRGWHEN